VAHTLIQLAFVALAVLASLIAVRVNHHVLRVIGRRVAMVTLLTRRTHRPFQAVVAFATLDVVLRGRDLTGHWRAPVTHLLDLCVIGAAAWLLTALLFVFEDAALAKFRTDVRDNRHARTVRTQITLVRRVTAAAVAVVAVGTMLMTFREVRIIGTSILASAGVLAAVAAFAAQALLGNVFAGLQLAFGKSLRLDDVVVVESEWGRIEAITLTYVVVHLWDDRRLIFPTSYFTTTPFENWTRSDSSLIGAVEMELDWTLPVDEMREELLATLADTDLWDHRIGVLQVTDAVGGLVRLRALVSAGDAGTLWDLRCHVRERMINWVRHNHPESLPRQRMEVGSAQRRRERTTPVAPHEVHPEEEGSRVFGGDAEGRERGNVFHGPAANVRIDPSRVLDARLPK
jgi:small-conductance mechanosensitive channel